MSSTDEGASPKEQLIEASRRNNPSLLNTLLSSPPLSSSASQIATFLNTTTDALGSSALHVAARYGAYDVLDVILDQEGVEIDGHEKREGDTALHCAVRFCNSLAVGDEEGRAVVDILIDAGCDPRIRNDHKLKPADLVDPRNTELRKALQQAEILAAASADAVVEDDEDDVRDGPGSESD
ncbi:ankyrin repeat protein [Zymoseptoria brevis]|uniref:Ankyrin repeat protein n=1 Tax=Zymoseptoria brevis TaxID=1047168 RepID=A0A0F4GLR0_9PEZI|nr:ankyrin repeat protein [Zymoseptoria brevis]